MPSAAAVRRSLMTSALYYWLPLELVATVAVLREEVSSGLPRLWPALLVAAAAFLLTNSLHFFSDNLTASRPAGL
jgi:hypothetical protein